MNLKQTLTWSKWTGRIGSFLCILLFLIILDALVSRFRESPNHFSGLPGSRMAVNGPLREKIENVEELTYQSNSKEIHLDFEATQTGFWLGGYMWNGHLTISPRIQPGGYQLTVQTRKTRGEKAVSFFQIKVYKDLKGLQQDSKSFMIRFLGMYPWQALLFLIPCVLFMFGAVFYLSHKTETLMAEQGKAEVYRIKNGKEGLEISFGLGRKQGVQPGTCLTLMDNQGKALGSIIAGEVFEDHSKAQVELGLKVQPGFIISLSG